MEARESNDDYFSELVIHQFDSQNEVSEEPNQKLKARRKSKDNSKDDLRKNASRFKLKVKYDGYFRLINKGTKRKYCFGRQKTIYTNQQSFSFVELLEEVSCLYHLDENINLSIYYLDQCGSTQSFVQIEDNESYIKMLTIYEEKKEALIYVTKESLDESSEKDCSWVNNIEIENPEIENYEEESDYCHSEESYHSRNSDTDDGDEDDTDFSFEGEFYSYDKDDPKMEVGATFPHVVAFRGALNHYAVIKGFQFNLIKSEPKRVTAICATRECGWRIHASVDKDDQTFIVRTMQPNHDCYGGANKHGNKHATRGWVADRVVDYLKSDGDISAKDLKEKLERKFGLLLPYDTVWGGKELAMQEIYGKWSDSFFHIGALKEEILKRNPESVVEFGTEVVEENQHFQRFFVAFGACITGFLSGCRPYIALDACHMKGKWKGVVAAAISVDGNNYMFPVAFGVMEGENENSWEWFLRALHKAIEMPQGLVISADMQKGLQNALTKVYPFAEHRECMRHLFSNFKKHFHGDLFKFGLWGAARTYSPNKFDALINEMNIHCPEGIQYLNNEHKNIWSRSKFGTESKCDYLTNNMAETFNSWISGERYKPVIDLLDSIRQKIMVKFDQRRRIANKWKGPLVPKVADDIKRISRSLHLYTVQRSVDSCAEVQKDRLRWEVNLDEQKCSCRAWQVRGIPCVHAAAFIASIRNAKWENYVHSYFTVDRFKMAYARGIAPMPSRNEWMKVDLGYDMLPPTLKRPPGRPRKNRIKASDEPKKKPHKCTRCHEYGHHKTTCKNTVPSQQSEGPQIHKKNTKRGGNAGKGRTKKRACPSSIFRILQEEEN